MSEGGGGINITLYGFSIMKEPLEKAIYPAFAAKAKREHNLDIHFTSSRRALRSQLIRAAHKFSFLSTSR